MCDKVKIKNNGDWICPKCEAQNSEHKDNIKIINKVLCNSCYSEFELDKDENQKNDIEIKMSSYNNATIVNVNGETIWMTKDEEINETADGIWAILKKLGIESEIVDD